MSHSPPKRRELFQYSFIAMPLAFASLPLYIHAPDFYAREFGLGIGLIGVILILIRLFDAFQDPVIGYLSDKYAKKRYSMMSIGAAMLTAGIGAVFIGPSWEIYPALWFALSMILATTGFSIMAINLNMIGGFWQDDKNQRTRISGWREAFMLCGLLIASILPAALETMYSPQQAYIALFFVFAGMMAIGFALFSRFMIRTLQDHAMNKGDVNSGFAFLSILMGPQKRFYFICFLTHIAASIPAVLVLFFIRDYLGAEEFSGAFLFLYFISGEVFMQGWIKLSEKIGKEKAWFYSMLLAVATFVWAFFLQSGDIYMYGIICVLSGIALGADLALPPAILADKISAQKTKSEATQHYALLAVIPKTAIALASGIAFITLDILGFEAAQDNTEQALFGLIALYALIPCFIKLAAAFILWRTFHNKGDTNAINTKRMDIHGHHDNS
ncbi:MAG: MFS transporter [Alphaproteobacteria bacterium]